MAEKEPLKITLDDLAPDETPAKPESMRGGLQGKVEATGRTIADAARDVAGKATDKLTATASDATNRTAEMARDKVGEALQEQSRAIVDAVEQRVRELDWKNEAQKGTEGGLRWLSDKLNVLADRMKDPPSASDATEKKLPPSDK